MSEKMNIKPKKINKTDVKNRKTKINEPNQVVIETLKREIRIH